MPGPSETRRPVALRRHDGITVATVGLGAEVLIRVRLDAVPSELPQK